MIKINKDFFKKILILFMTLQPILDIYYLFEEKNQIFGFSISTIIRLILISLLAITAFYYCKNNKKIKYLFIYAIINVIYLVMHQYNVHQFSVVYGTFNYSTLSELFYIVRMIMPFIIVFSTIEYKINKKEFIKVIINSMLIFSSIMVLTNLFKIALASYGGGNFIISDNFISWFFGVYKKYSYDLLASKGIFHMANQVSATMFILLPFVVYDFLNKFSIKTLVTIVLSMLSMLMLGTRVASYGCYLVVSIVAIGYIVFYFYNKKKDLFNKKSFIMLLFIFLLFLFVFKFSPIQNRVYSSDYNDSITSNINNNHDATNKLKELNEYFHSNNDIDSLEYNTKKEEATKFIYDNYEEYGFSTDYLIDNYSYKDDFVFWLEMMEKPYLERSSARDVQKYITQRVYSLNNNKYDSLFGMSFTRLRNGNSYIEKDLVTHFYSIGIIGIILYIIPYLAITIFGVVVCIRNYKSNFNLINCLFVLSIFLTFITGFLSGNVFDELIVTLYLGFIVGAFINNLKYVK